MRLFIILLSILLLGVCFASAYLFGQSSVDVSIQEIDVKPVTVMVKAVPCITAQPPKQIKATLSFPLITVVDKSVIKKKSKNRTRSKSRLKPPKDSIDTVVIHAIRDGKWSKSDNKVFLYYLANLNKKQRIEVLKHLNHAINYQQMDVGKEFKMPRL